MPCPSMKAFSCVAAGWWCLLQASRVDIRTALEIDETQYENAQRLESKGAALARDLGLDVEALVVAEDS